MDPLGLTTILHRKDGEDGTLDQYSPNDPIQNHRGPSSLHSLWARASTTYEHVPHPEQQFGTTPQSPNAERNHRLLRFSNPRLPHSLLDITGSKTTASISAQLHGMFFLAESPWDGSPSTAELTCYRRNLFQVSGTATVPRNLHSLKDQTGEQVHIVKTELVISATESLDGKAIKIISVPWKNPASNTTGTEQKSDDTPMSHSLDFSYGYDMDSESAQFPISWSRLQFRTATANNGKRKELQQHFVVWLKIVATLANGTQTSICEVHSGAITVRGRSPKSFQSRKEIPLTDYHGRGAGRRSDAATPRSKQSPTVESNKSRLGSTTQFNWPTPDLEGNSMSNFHFPSFQHDATSFSLSADFLDDWEFPETMTTTSLETIPPVSLDTNIAPSISELSPKTARVQQPKAPVRLYLTEDERDKDSATLTVTSRKQARLDIADDRSPHVRGDYTADEESADLLYEYFPLGLDDWMPHVDAIYRPHVVHQLMIPDDPMTAALKDRSKRYYSET